MYEIPIYYNSEIFHIPTFYLHTFHHTFNVSTQLNNTQVIVELVCIRTTYFLPISLAMHKTTKHRTSITHSVRQKGITNETSVDFNYIDHSWDGQYGLLCPYYHTVMLTAVDPFHYSSRIKLNHARVAVFL